MKVEVQLSPTRVETTSASHFSSGRASGIPNCDWTADLDELLRDSWDAGGASRAFEAISGVRPEWSRYAIQRRARKLGLERTSRGWSQDEVNLLLHAIGGCSSISALAAILKRSENSVRSKLRQLSYTTDDFDGYRPKDVANWLDLSVRQVRYWLERGYLRTRNHRISEESLCAFLRERPEAIPFERLSAEMRSWLRGLGYSEPNLSGAPPGERSTRRKPASSVQTLEPGAA
jgi:hypothetical protein